MKRLVWILCLAVFMPFFSMAVAQNNTNSAFKAANALYESEKFPEAAKAYGTIVDEKNGNAAVFYNLGNAELRSGRKGKAMLWYERAVLLKPRDPDIVWNLRVLKNALVDRIEAPPGILELGTIGRSIAARYSIDETAPVFSTLLLVWALLEFLIWKFSSVRGRARRIRGVVILLIVVVSGLLALKWMELKDPRVVILSKEVTARYGPTIKEAKAFTLHEGAVVRLIDETKDWIYVRLDDGKEGWLQKDTCETI